MNVVTTKISKVSLEIEGKEYAVAEKTIATANRLIEAQTRCAGMLQYKMWLAELEVLLGKDAMNELFCLGDDENIDRIERIHAAAVCGFEYNSNLLRDEQNSAAVEYVDKLVAALSELRDKVENSRG